MENVKLGEKWRLKLTQMPESGMGYQLVDVLLADGRKLTALIVFNGEECQTETAFDPNEIADLWLHQPPARRISPETI